MMSHRWRQTFGSFLYRRGLFNTSYRFYSGKLAGKAFDIYANKYKSWMDYCVLTKSKTVCLQSLSTFATIALDLTKNSIFRL